MQVEVFIPEVMEDRLETVISVKEVSGWLDRGGEAGSGSGVEVGVEASSECMVSILDLKYERNVSHLLVVNDVVMVSRGFRSLLTVEKSDFGLLLPERITEE